MANIQINSVVQRIQHANVGAGLVNFNIPFPFLADGDVTVYNDSTLLVLTTDYTLTGAGNAAGGTLTLNVATSGGENITILGNLTVDRTSIYNSSLNLLTGTDLNNDFNREILMISQREMYQDYLMLQYAPYTEISQTITDTDDRWLPLLAAGQVWRKNDGNTAIEATTLPTYPVGSVGGTFSNDNRMVKTDTSAGSNNLQETSITVSDTDVITGVGGITVAGLTYPTTDGLPGEVMQTDGAGNLSFQAAGTGDVVGPASSTDNAVTRFDGATGKLVQDSNVLIDDSGNMTGVADISATTATVTGDITASNITASRAVVTDGSSVLEASATTATELGYVNGVTSAIQTQLDTKIEADSVDTLTNKTFDANGTGNSLSNVDVADLADGTAGELITWDAANNPATVAVGTSGHVLTSNGPGAAPTFQASGGGGSSESVTLDVNQVAHGLSVGDWVYLNGATYTAAIATSAATAEVAGVVSAVADVDNFTLQMAGQITGLSSLTAGTVYFLSPSAAGEATATEPSVTGQISKPILIADSTTSGIVLPFRGVEVGAGGGGGSGSAVTLDVNQAGHGLFVGDWIYLNGATYTAAIATSLASSRVVGVVTAVADTDNFTFLMAGQATGLSGLTAGTPYYLSASIPGFLTSIEPSTAGQYSKPVLIADSTTSGVLTQFREKEIGSDTGLLQSIQVFTSTGLWVKPAGITKVIVEVIGGGGGGGGSEAVAGSCGGGGGAGGYAKELIDVTGTSSEVVTIGSGGAGGTTGGGSAGATSSFGTFCSATGGGGGARLLGGSTAGHYAYYGAGGAGSGGDVDGLGDPGRIGIRQSSTVVAGGAGGMSHYSGGGAGAQNSGAGTAGTHGSGGGGGATDAAVSQSGGDGGDGLCLVLEFA